MICLSLFICVIIYFTNSFTYAASSHLCSIQTKMSFAKLYDLTALISPKYLRGLFLVMMKIRFWLRHHSSANE